LALQVEAQKQATEVAKAFLCNDNNITVNTGDDSALIARLRLDLGVPSSKAGKTACKDLKGHCEGNVDILRLLCPVTCGCNLPRSDLWKRAGCPEDCTYRKAYTDQLLSIPCKDPLPKSLMQDSSWQRLIRNFLTAFGVTDETVISSSVDMGCKFVDWANQRSTDNVCRISASFASFLFWCPQACKCGLPGFPCPVNCSNR